MAIGVWLDAMSRRIGRRTYEGRFVIIQVPDDWTIGGPLPAANPDDQWFDSLSEFAAALGAPFDHRPINRRPWNAAQASPGPPREK